MSKKDDASKTLKKKLKKLKKLEAEIAALKAEVAGKPKAAESVESKSKKNKDKDKDKAAKHKAAKSKTGKSKGGKHKAGKSKAGKPGNEAASETAMKPAAPSLVRSEPAKTVVKEATSAPQTPSARVAAG